MSWGKLTSLARSRCVLPVLAAGLVLSAVARAQEAAPLTWEALEARGAVIGDVVIDSGNVFDPKQPGEDHWLARLANALHMTTRPEVLRRELGFAPGDRVSARRIHEAERKPGPRGRSPIPGGARPAGWSCAGRWRDRKSVV